MVLVGNALIAGASVVHSVLTFAWAILIARIVLSWVQPSPSNPTVRSLLSAVYGLTDPVLLRTRRLLPFLQVGQLDLSPIALFLAISFLDEVVPNTMIQLGYGLL